MWLNRAAGLLRGHRSGVALIGGVVCPLGVANGRGTLRIGVALGAGGLIGGYYEARIQPRRPQVSELSTVDPGRSPAAG